MYNVIIIDDEPWITIDIQESFRLEELGFHIIGSFRDPAAALIEITTKRPDLVITDIRMPNMSGIDLMKKVRGQGIGCEFIIVSGYSEFAYAKEALQYGASSYCLKPLDSEEASFAILKVKETLDKSHGVLQPAKAPAPDHTDSLEDSFHQLLRYIEFHFYDKLTLKELSQKFNLNPNYCCALFTRYKNTTFSQYLTDIRISEARNLLTSSEHSLEEIASLVGFSDYFYFSKVFKKTCNISPKDYRKKSRG